jgi:hypothetical protein
MFPQPQGLTELHGGSKATARRTGSRAEVPAAKDPLQMPFAREL